MWRQPQGPQDRNRILNYVRNQQRTLCAVVLGHAHKPGVVVLMRSIIRLRNVSQISVDAVPSRHFESNGNSTTLFPAGRRLAWVLCASQQSQRDDSPILFLIASGRELVCTLLFDGLSYSMIAIPPRRPFGYNSSDHACAPHIFGVAFRFLASNGSLSPLHFKPMKWNGAVE